MSRKLTGLGTEGRMRCRWKLSGRGPRPPPCRAFSLTAQESMNWVLCVFLQIRSPEEGLLYTQSLACTFGDACCWWVGPWHAIVRIFHPTCIKPVLFAPGRHRAGHALSTAGLSVLPPAGPVPTCRQEGPWWRCHCLRLPWTSTCLASVPVCSCLGRVSLMAVVWSGLPYGRVLSRVYLHLGLVTSERCYAWLHLVLHYNRSPVELVTCRAHL